MDEILKLAMSSVMNGVNLQRTVMQQELLHLRSELTTKVGIGPENCASCSDPYIGGYCDGLEVAIAAIDKLLSPQPSHSVTTDSPQPVK